MNKKTEIAKDGWGGVVIADWRVTSALAPTEIVLHSTRGTYPQFSIHYVIPCNIVRLKGKSTDITLSDDEMRWVGPTSKLDTGTTEDSR